MNDLIERLRADAELIHNNGITRKLRRHRVAALLREAADALEAAREDAERYRWLRDREIPEWLDLWHQNPDRIDAAIDQARGKGGP